MSKIINNLTPEDFGKSFDMASFSEWKKRVEEHEKASVIMLTLYFIGFACMMLLFGNIIGVALFFLFAFIGLGIGLPKFNKRRKLQKQLGISASELRNAIANAKKRMK